MQVLMNVQKTPSTFSCASAATQSGPIASVRVATPIAQNPSISRKAMSSTASNPADPPEVSRYPIDDVHGQPLVPSRIVILLCRFGCPHLTALHLLVLVGAHLELLECALLIDPDQTPGLV